MNKKNVMFTVLSVLSLLLIVGAWFWYSNYKITDNSLRNIKNRGVLVVCSDIPYGVMEFFDENHNPVGIDVDIAKEIATRLGVTIKFNDYDWDTLLAKVKNNEVDLAISTITITPERQKEMLFSDPYFSGGQVIIVSNDNQEIKGVNDLSGKKIAAQKNTTSYTEAKKYTLENLIYTYIDFDTVSNTNIVKEFKDGKFDAIIVDYTQALVIIKNNADLKIVGIPFTKEDYGIASKISNTSLINKINSILLEMEKDGTLEKIKTKWTKI